MGEKGARSSPAAAALADSTVKRLASLGEVSARPMFGGFGIYAGSAMFGIVSSDAELFLKAGDSNRALFESSGSRRHGKMPYFSVPERVLGSAASLRRWASRSIAAAGATAAAPRGRKRSR